METIEGSAVQEEQTGSHQDQRQKKQKPPRAKRIRKRPRSETDANASLLNELTTSVVPLVNTATKLPILEAGKEQLIRVVHPYPYTFASFCKKRWIHRTVLDVYTSEFGSYPENYYIAAITQGRILVSGERVGLDYRIKEHDVLTHTVHRHEPAVSVASAAPQVKRNENDAAQQSEVSASTPIDTKIISSGNDSDQPDPADTSHTTLVNIVEETDDLLVVDKPGTMPVHPCGGYHLNSLTEILEGRKMAENGSNSNSNNNKHYFTIHRLDRLTSGLVILAKSSPVAKHWSQCIRQRDCQKYYLARVKGRFPLNLERNMDGDLLGRINPVSGTSRTDVPQDGEWPQNNPTENTSVHDSSSSSSSSSSKDTKVSTTIDKLRSSHAHDYWITDDSGNNLLEKVSLSDLANSEINNLDECLEDLDKLRQQEGKDKNITTKDNNSPTTNSSKKSSLRWLHLACPTRIVQPKIGVCAAGRFEELEDDLYVKTVKPAQTSFAVIRYDAITDSTIILCRPVTGRTHQIRLHCQYLGHSIANDPNYGGDIWYGNPAGQEACITARRLLDVNDSAIDDANTKAKDSTTDRRRTATTEQYKNVSDTPASVNEIEAVSQMAKRGEDEPTGDFIKRTCVWCARCKDRDVVENTMLEFLVRSRGIWLHALKYSIGGGGDSDKNNFCSFRTEMPSWGR